MYPWPRSKQLLMYCKSYWHRVITKALIIHSTYQPPVPPTVTFTLLIPARDFLMGESTRIFSDQQSNVVIGPRGFDRYADLPMRGPGHKRYLASARVQSSRNLVLTFAYCSVDSISYSLERYLKYQRSISQRFSRGKQAATHSPISKVNSSMASSPRMKGRSPGDSP